jgi:hypothetical protein
MELAQLVTRPSWFLMRNARELDLLEAGNILRVSTRDITESVAQCSFKLV